MEWGAFGWLTIAAIVIAAATGLHFAAHAGRRWLERHVPADVLADARAGAPDVEDVAAAGPPSLLEPDSPLTQSGSDLPR